MTTYIQQQEYGIPVIFDVTAGSREDAGNTLVAMLSGHNLPGTRLANGGGTIESWWTLEGIDKRFDRNDNDAGVVLFAEDLDYLHMLLCAVASDGVPASNRLRHERLLRYLHPNCRIGWTNDETEGA